MVLACRLVNYFTFFSHLICLYCLVAVFFAPNIRIDLGRHLSSFRADFQFFDSSRPFAAWGRGYVLASQLLRL